MEVKLMIKDGKDLSSGELETINLWMKKEFNSRTAIQLKLGDDNWLKKYFLLVNDEGKVAAFGRLHEVNLEFLGKEYSIYGVASIVSTERGKGFGKQLVLEMKKYIAGSGKTGIGFCHKELSGFYKSCGFGIVPDGAKRFWYKNDADELIGGPGGDVIYIKGRDGFVDVFLENAAAEVISYRQHW